jgi:hypothetical protein
MDSINTIWLLSPNISPLEFNQATRWVATKVREERRNTHFISLLNPSNMKDTHANHIISVISEYFLAQRVKEVASGSAEYDDYLTRLNEHHLVCFFFLKRERFSHTYLTGDSCRHENKTKCECSRCRSSSGNSNNTRREILPLT